MGTTTETEAVGLDGRRALPRVASLNALGGGLVRFLRSSTTGAISLVFLLLVLAIAVLALKLAPYDPLANDLRLLMQPPTAAHWLGTDQVGRDVFSRLLLGTQISLIVAGLAVAIGDTIGFTWGITAGYSSPGRFDLTSQRLVDILMSFPALILAMLLMTGLGAGIHTVVIAIAATRIPATCRVVRSMVLSIKEMQYVDAARVVGASYWRIMFRHVAPQCVAPMLVLVSLHLGVAIFIEAALSYLGVGVPPPIPSLGNMLGEQVSQAFKPPWWVVVFPGAAITAIIMAANLLGDALRDFLDPRLRHTR